MPRAGDAFLVGALPQTNNPLARIDSSFFTPVFDVEAFIEQITTFVETYLFPVIEDLTGLDLTILQPFIDGLFGALEGIVSGDWSKLFDVFGNLFSFLNFDLTNPSFDPITAAIQWFINILHPSGLAVGASDVLGSVVADTLIIPFTVGDESTSAVRQWFIDIPQAIRDVLQNLVNAFKKADPTGITGFFGDLMLQGYDLFTGLYTKTQTLQRSVNALESKVFGELGANAITFSFSGATAALSTLGWTLIDAGAAGMTYTQHDDYVQMTGSAGSDASVIAIFDSADPAQHFTSHIQSCTFLPREAIASSGDTALFMPLRTNNATTLGGLTSCYARVVQSGTGEVNLGIFLDGVATDLAAIPGVDPDLVGASGLTFSYQDRFDFTLGDPDADPITETDQYNWRWRWYLNTHLILDTVYNPFAWDADTADMLDETTYNCPAFGMTADFIFFGFSAMIPPTTLDGLAYYTPAAA